MSGELDVRASDADRERVLADLRDHCAQGRLTLEELGERIDEAYAARTLGELEAVRRELPAESAPAAVRRRPKRLTIAIMSGMTRRGRWRVPRRSLVFAMMGGADLDLRHAEIDAPMVTITAVAFMGGIDVYVPESVELDVGGLALMGGFDEHGPDKPARAGAPLVRVRGLAFIGGIDVRRVPAGSEDRSLRELARGARPGRPA